MTDKFNEKQGILLQGYIKITDPTTGEVLVDKRNAIHYENMSISLADSLSNQGQGMIYQMAFGNGGDRGKGNIPEEDYCNSMGVDMVWGLGDKVQSSSWLIEKALNSAV